MYKGKVTIDGREMTLRETNGVIIKYEDMSGKSSFTGLNTHTDFVQLFYCNVFENNDVDWTFEQFKKKIDQEENEQSLAFFMLYREESTERLKQWQKVNDPRYADKKKAAQQMAKVMDLASKDATK